MPDNPELIEKYGSKFIELITQMHNDGLGYPAIHFILDQTLGNLKLKGKAEGYLSQDAPESFKG